MRRNARPTGLQLFDAPRAWRVLLFLLALHVVAFALLYPVAITVSDESTYIRQAHLMLEGSTSVAAIDP